MPNCEKRSNFAFKQITCVLALFDARARLHGQLSFWWIVLYSLLKRIMPKQGYSDPITVSRNKTDNNDIADLMKSTDVNTAGKRHGFKCKFIINENMLSSNL